MSLAPSSLFPSIRYLYTLIRSSHSLLFSKLNSQLSQPLLASQILYSLIFMVFCIHSSMSTSLSYWEFRTARNTPDVSHQCWVEGNDYLPSPEGNTLTNVAQKAVGFLCHKGTFLAHVQPAAHQGHQVLFCKAAFQTPACTGAGGYFSQMQDIGLPFVELHETPVGPSLHPVKVPLNDSTPIWCIDHYSQFCITCKLSECVLCTIIQITLDQVNLA